MPEPAIDHRRATAERNAAAILDATERLLAKRSALSMAAVAAEAGVSRPTLYAHHKTLGDVVEAAAARLVESSIAAFDAARPDEGAPGEALTRVLAASWGELARHQVLVAAGAEYLPADHVHRTHRPLMIRFKRLVERGQKDGSFRTDLSADWLVTTFYALVHSADEHARTHRVSRAKTLELLTKTVLELFEPR
jgi:AcrR family transcriptional regulator